MIESVLSQLVQQTPALVGFLIMMIVVLRHIKHSDDANREHIRSSDAANREVTRELRDAIKELSAEMREERKK